MSNFLRRSIVACLLALVFSCLPGAQEGPRETIVFTTLRPANQDIYLVNPAGDGPRRMTDHPGLDYNATFSPDGRWLVFTAERDGNADLYALDLEREGEPVRLTRHRGLDDAADVSGDGEEIVFVSTQAGNADVHVMPFRPNDPTGAEEEAVNLTRHPLGDFQPAFSPDGSSIAFSRQLQRAEIQVENPALLGPAQSVMTHLFLMERDGSQVRRLVGEVPFRPRAGHMTSGSPAWSRDGQTVYFHAAPFDAIGGGPEWTADLWRVGTDGSDLQRFVASDSLHMVTPAVGPRGELLFHAEPPLAPREQMKYRAGTIYSAAADGSGPRREIGSGGPDACFAPAVGPQGRVACHGPGPVEALSPKADGDPLLRPGTHATIELPDRTVRLVGMHGYFPDFLPDGRVAYGESLPQTGYVERHGVPPVVTSRLDGSERRVALETDSLPAWATSTCRRDGRIAFNTGPDFAPVDAPVDIWTVRPDGTGLKNLTNDDGSNDAFPAWSSDCDHIVFRSGRDGNKEIYVMEDDGSEPRRLTRHPATETAPAISPDGQWVVFATGRDHTTAEDAEDLVPISRQGRGGGAGFRLWIQRLDGTEGRFLEPDLVGVPGRDMHPWFSPDGRWVLFVSSRGGINDEFLLSAGPQPYGELWAVPVEGGRAVRLTHDKWEDGPARWGTGAGQQAPEIPQDRQSFVCTQVLGFSQSLEWFGGLSLEPYTEGPGSVELPGLPKGVFLPAWQGRFYPGASVEDWMDPGHPGWSGSSVRGRETPAYCAPDEVDRVVFNASGASRSPEAWAAAVDSVTELVRSKFPAVRRVVVQPAVGAPEGQCQDVLAARNHPEIVEGIRRAAERGAVTAGPEPKVAACDHFRDGLGHLTEEGAEHVQEVLRDHYRGTTAQNTHE